MPVVPAPLSHGEQGAREPALGRSLSHHVTALSGFPPDVGEAEKVERWFFAVWMCTVFPHGPEVDEAGLFGMQREPIPSKTLLENFQYPLGIAVVLEGHHEVIGEPNQGAWSRH